MAHEVAFLILLTGFEPFDGALDNPSWRVAQALDGQRIAGHGVIAAQLPTVFGASLTTLERLLRLHAPAIVLCLGQAGGRATLCIERVGINLDDARIPDNAGSQPVDVPVIAAGPAAYFSTLPIKAMRLAAQRAGVPCEVSQTAGTFVCNHVLYGLLHMLENNRGSHHARGGFVHVPWLASQGVPHLPLRDMVRGVHAALWAAALTGPDLRIAAGAMH